MARGTYVYQASDEREWEGHGFGSRKLKSYDKWCPTMTGISFDQCTISYSEDMLLRAGVPYKIVGRYAILIEQKLEMLWRTLKLLAESRWWHGGTRIVPSRRVGIRRPRVFRAIQTYAQYNGLFPKFLHVKTHYGRMNYYCKRRTWLWSPIMVRPADSRNLMRWLRQLLTAPSRPDSCSWKLTYHEADGRIENIRESFFVVAAEFWWVPRRSLKKHGELATVEGSWRLDAWMTPLNASDSRCYK